MEILNTIKSLGTLVGLTKPEETKPGQPEPTGNIIRDTINRFGGKEQQEAQKTQENAEKERAGIFTEAFSSVLTRYFPNVSKLTTLASAGMDLAGIRKRAPEAHPLQNEIDNILALTLLVPDFMLKKVTDPFVKSEKFMTLVEHWPLLPQDMVQKIKKENYDPDDVINVFRVMSQDLSSGTVVISRLIEKVFGGKGVIDTLKSVAA
ncbi:MAG TPA: hypothetical protein P5229_04605 [Candidatus Gracilibacteria bacterium]|nr:hypothetical protein [Candidatus Gracilibacteria bacterium]